MAEYGEMTPEIRAELDMWLAGDGRHRAAFLRARAGLYMAEDAVIEAHAPPHVSSPVSDNDNRVEHREYAPGPRPRGFSRWSGRAVAGGAALVASVAALVAMGSLALSPLPRTETGAAGRIVALKDGSVATLGKDAKIEVMFSPDFRRITLASGEATFKVAHDKTRPFVVQSGDVYAQATGTVYSVNRVDMTGGTVKVTEGSVLVWARDERDQAILLRAGGELTLKPGPRLPAPKPIASAPHLPPPDLAQIAFDNEPIRSAVVRFNRVNSTKIVIADPQIGDTEIVGLFRANDVERFAQAAATVSGGTVEHEQGRIVIKKK